MGEHKEEPLTLLFLRQTIYHITDRIFKERNPCDYVNNRCKIDRRNNKVGQCCRLCKHIVSNKCSIKSMACKLYLCMSMKIQDPYLDGYLQALSDICGMVNIELNIREE